MRTLRQRAVIPRAPDAVFARLADFAAYPAVTPSVRSVEVLDRDGAPGGPHTCRSAWDVAFRTGTLRWVERDRVDPARRTVSFEQERGDLESLEGSWEVRPHARGSELRFEVRFALGLPGLEEFLEPVAERALEENVRELVTRLFDGAVLAPSSRAA